MLSSAPSPAAPPGSPHRPHPAGGRHTAGPVLRSAAASQARIDGVGGFAHLVEGIARLGHLPVVGTLYRTVTLQDVRPALRVLGGLATGGPPGALAAAVAVVAEEVAAPGVAAPPAAAAGGAPRPGRGAAADAAPAAPLVARTGMAADLARRLQVGLAAYDRTRAQAELAPGSLVAAAGRAAA